MQAWSITGRDCSSLDDLNESELITELKGRKLAENNICFKDDAVSKDALKVFRMIYNLVSQMKGLPSPLLKKWNELRYEQVQMYGTNLNLCLQDVCDQDSSLVAKNFRFRKKGFILINNAKWSGLSLEDKFSLVWHEALTLLGFEKNSYQYSSLVEFRVECRTTHPLIDRVSSTCDIVANLLDPSLLYP